MLVSEKEKDEYLRSILTPEEVNFYYFMKEWCENIRKQQEENKSK